jgi:hypothetical protein
MRTKFIVTERRETAGGLTVALTPVDDPTIPTAQRFAQATASGRIDLFVDNALALKALPIGAVVFADFTLDPALLAAAAVVAA